MINALPVVAALLICQSGTGGTASGNPPAGNLPTTVDKSVETADQIHTADLKRDAEIGKKYSEEVEKQYKLSKNADDQARVQRIGAVIADVANHNHVKALWGDTRHNTFEYHYKVLEGDDVNAFSLPGGYIYVYEGLIKFVESDDELAGVLAHETAHAAFRHLATLQREESKLEAFTIPLVLVAILAGAGAGGNLLTVGNLAGIAIGSGWSQKAEQAADYGGFQFMVKSRYNPVGMLTFMERLVAEERKSPELDYGIYRDHPPTRERADELMEWMANAGIPVKRSLVTTTFRTTLKTAKDGGVEAWFGGRKLYTFAGPDAETRAEQAAVSVDAFMDQVPELFDVTSSDDGTIFGKGKPLFKVSAADAAEAGYPLAESTRRAMMSVKRSLSFLGYRVWDVH